MDPSHGSPLSILPVVRGRTRPRSICRNTPSPKLGGMQNPQDQHMLPEPSDVNTSSRAPKLEKESHEAVKVMCRYFEKTYSTTGSETKMPRYARRVYANHPAPERNQS